MKTQSLTSKLSKIMTMKGGFKFRLGAVHSLRAVSENRMEPKQSLVSKLATIQPVWSGKATYLLG
jgi:hypothetical protein